MPRRKQSRRIDVKDIKSILRLTYESGLSVREVSERLGLSKSAVSTYLLRAREAGVAAWPMPAGHKDDATLERRLFRQMGRPSRDMTEPDWQLVSREMKRKSMTLLLLWQEYREAHPDGFGYTWFCDKFSRHTRRVNPTSPCDMRKGFDGLSAQVRNILRLDPFSDAVFLFRGKSGIALRRWYGMDRACACPKL